MVVKGAREHNLKGVDLTFPRDSLTTFTGVSGSGKSSLAYHTIYQEGQRRFLESLSSYARQFLGRMEKPKVDLVEGLSPTVSIDQKSTSHSARSTVGTLTEVSDFLRLLWSRLGDPSCPECGAAIEAWSPDRIVEAIVAGHQGVAAMLLAPVVRERKGEYRKELAEWAQKGFVRARIDGVVRRLDEEITLARYAYHTIELVVDRLTITADARSRLAEAVEQAVQLGGGLCALAWGDGEHRLFSTQRSCPNGHGALPELEPRLFSFNSPIGACAKCDGLGETFGFAPELLVRDAVQVDPRRGPARLHRRRAPRLRPADDRPPGRGRPRVRLRRRHAVAEAAGEGEEDRAARLGQPDLRIPVEAPECDVHHPPAATASPSPVCSATSRASTGRRAPATSTASVRRSPARSATARGCRRRRARWRSRAAPCPTCWRCRSTRRWRGCGRSC